MISTLLEMLAVIVISMITFKPLNGNIKVFKLTESVFNQIYKDEVDFLYTKGKKFKGWSK